MKELLTIIQFAQRLADNDKRIRDRALKKLRTYLSSKSTPIPGTTDDDDALKLWKGLFYCMYMADKPLTQEAVAEHISTLIHYINKSEAKMSFIRAAFLTFAREWNGIDVFRINKFMMFIRRFLRQVFIYLRESGWEKQGLVSIVTILETTVVVPEDDNNSTPLGLKLHLCGIVLDELAKIGGDNLENRVIVAILQPYFKVLALTRIDAYFKSVKNDIIRHLMRQSSLGQKYEEGEEVIVTEDEEEGTNPMKQGEEQAREEMEVESDYRSKEEAVLDPRAGQVDVYIPQLKPDFNKLADVLQTIGGVSRVRKKNRENLYQLVSELRDMACGCYPLTVPLDNVGDDLEVPEDEEEKAIKRLQKFQENLRTGQKTESSDDDSGVDLGPSKKEIQKRRLDKMKMKKKQQQKASKAASNAEKKKGLTRSEKRKYNKKQAARAAKRTRAVENMLQCVGYVAVNPTTAIVKKTTDGMSGFKVSTISKKKVNAGNMYVNTGFTVEVSKSGTKRKKTSNELPEVPSKRKTNSFVVSNVPHPQKEVNSLVSDQSRIDRKEVKKSSNGVKLCQSGNKKENKSEGVSLPNSNGNRPIELASGILSKNINISDASSPSGKETALLGKKAKKQSISTKLQNTKTKTVISGRLSENVKSCKASCPSVEKTATLGKKKKSIGTNSQNTKTDTATSTDDTPSSNKKLVINFSDTSENKWFKDAPMSDKGWEEPLKEGEIEIFIKSRKQISKEKKYKSSKTKKILKVQSLKNRTININLKRNQEHEYSDYVRSVKASPNIPFSADLQPSAPAIKKRASALMASSASPLLKMAKCKKIKKTVRKGLGLN